jgi:hypothetical protein
VDGRNIRISNLISGIAEYSDPPLISFEESGPSPIRSLRTTKKYSGTIIINSDPPTCSSR